MDLLTIWMFLKPKMDAELASATPEQSGAKLAALIREKYPTAADRERFARVLGAAAGALT